jgi:hypothetical protein
VRERHIGLEEKLHPFWTSVVVGFGWLTLHCGCCISWEGSIDIAIGDGRAALDAVTKRNAFPSYQLILVIGSTVTSQTELPQVCEDLKP